MQLYLMFADDVVGPNSDNGLYGSTNQLLVEDLSSS